MIRIFLEDIKIAKSNSAYLSALALALTIPDILGKFQYDRYPKMDSKDKYIQWFNDWVYKYFEIPKSNNNDFNNYDELVKFDGEICYILRNEFLHNGKNINKNNGIKIDRFELCISDSEWQFGDGHGCQICDDEIVETYRRINISNLLDYFINATEDYLKQRVDDLEKYEIIKIIKI